MLKRGVYIAEFGDLMELTAVDQEGRVLRRTSIHRDYYSDWDVEMFENWLDRMAPANKRRSSQPGFPALRVVS